MTETEIKAAAKPILVRPAGAKRPLVAKTLDDVSGNFKKFLLQGNSGTGKTRTLAEVLQTKNAVGEANRVFVASTDLGGHGLATVSDRLQAVGRPELLANLAWVDFDDFDTFDSFVRGALVPTVGGKSLWEWNPDVLCHDGFANFQESHVWRHVMGIAPDGAATESREEGVQASQREWGWVRRDSLLAIDLFLRLHNPLSGKKLSKIITVLMDDGKEDKFTHETKKGPLVIGAARSYMPAGFDYVITLKALTKPGSKTPDYSYTCDVGGNVVSKQRGGEFLRFPEAAMKTADFKVLWETLVGGCAASSVIPAASTV